MPLEGPLLEAPGSSLFGLSGILAVGSSRCLHSHAEALRVRSWGHRVLQMIHAFNLRTLEGVAGSSLEVEASQGYTVTPCFHKSSSCWLVSLLASLGNRKDHLVLFWTS